MNKTITAILVITAVILIGAVLIVLISGPQAIMSRMMGVEAPPNDLDTATTRLSEQGIFNVTYSSSNNPIPINQIHAWTIHVETADGQPVEQADIGIDGGMPQHGHGLPTQPEVTQDLGSGDYLVEGMKFNMPGWWTVTFRITANDQSDTVTFNLVLE
jgi:YtkA-like